MIQNLIAVSLFAFISIQLQAQSNTDTTADSAKKEYTTLQKEAIFPGGVNGWRRYLENNLDISVGSRYIKLKRGEQSATQTVQVAFLVDKQGNISNVEVLNPDEVHPKVAAEAIRVIRDGPKWIPAVQNGKNVIYRQKQNIIFQVTKS